jgi:hypothetical protein
MWDSGLSWSCGVRVASPAAWRHSRRIDMGGVPAWLRWPVKRTRSSRMPTMGGDDADGFPGGLQPAALFDVRLQIAHMPSLFETDPRHPRQPGGVQRIPEPLPLPVACATDRLLHGIAYEAAAAEESGKSALFIAP